MTVFRCFRAVSLPDAENSGRALQAVAGANRQTFFQPARRALQYRVAVDCAGRHCRGRLGRTSALCHIDDNTSTVKRNSFNQRQQRQHSLFWSTMTLIKSKIDSRKSSISFEMILSCWSSVVGTGGAGLFGGIVVDVVVAFSLFVVDI